MKATKIALLAAMATAFALAAQAVPDETLDANRLPEDAAPDTALQAPPDASANAPDAPPADDAAVRRPHRGPKRHHGPRDSYGDHGFRGPHAPRCGHDTPSSDGDRQYFGPRGPRDSRDGERPDFGRRGPRNIACHGPEGMLPPALLEDEKVADLCDAIDKQSIVVRALARKARHAEEGPERDALVADLRSALRDLTVATDAFHDYRIEQLEKAAAEQIARLKERAQAAKDGRDAFVESELDRLLVPRHSRGSRGGHVEREDAKR